MLALTDVQATQQDECTAALKSCFENCKEREGFGLLGLFRGEFEGEPFALGRKPENGTCRKPRSTGVL